MKARIEHLEIDLHDVNVNIELTPFAIAEYICNMPALDQADLIKEIAKIREANKMAFFNKLVSSSIEIKDKKNVRDLIRSLHNAVIQ